MAKKKVVDPLGTQIEEKAGVVLFKVNQRLMKHEHDLLTERIKEEEKRTGLRIVLVPFTVDAEIGGDEE